MVKVVLYLSTFPPVTSSPRRSKTRRTKEIPLKIQPELLCWKLSKRSVLSLSKKKRIKWKGKREREKRENTRAKLQSIETIPRSRRSSGENSGLTIASLSLRRENKKIPSPRRLNFVSCLRFQRRRARSPLLLISAIYMRVYRIIMKFAIRMRDDTKFLTRGSEPRKYRKFSGKKIISEFPRNGDVSFSFSLFFLYFTRKFITFEVEWKMMMMMMIYFRRSKSRSSFYYTSK